MRARWCAPTRVAVRVPLLAIDEVLAVGEDEAAQRAWLDELLARPEVAEAIWLASPGLHAEIATWRRAPDSERGRSIERALVKYVTRMATRSTPFGLFAGIGVVDVGGRDGAVEIGEVARHRRRTRVDNELLFELAAAIARSAEGRAALTWWPSTSLARVAGTLRYAEARVEVGGIRYHLVSVEETPHLAATLARAQDGAPLGELADALVCAEEGIDVAAARAYVEELADAQLLVPELAVDVTGAEPIDGLIARLQATGLDEHAAPLIEARAALAAIDAAGVGAEPSAYEPVLAALERAFARAGAARTMERARLVQTDLGAALAGSIGAATVARVERTVEALRAMTPARTDAALDAFRRAFRARWEDREVALAEVLDEESGIGFARATGPGSEGAPLLAGLPFESGAVGEAAWTRRDAWLLARLVRTWTAGEAELVLDEEAQRALAAEAPAPLPDAWAAMVRIGRDELLVEGGGGPSGARLLGRFCHLDGGIEALVRAHVAAEAALRPEAVFAEIAHLPEGRTGNILCRPVLREVEVVYLGSSGAPRAAQLGLDDLQVSVRGERVVLRSHQLGREVVPRLTSAHNVHARGLGVYRFLAAVQGQDGGSVGWSWGALADAPRLPRVRLGGVVVARAQWTLDAGELEGLVRAGRAGRAMAAVGALRARLGLPRHVVLVDGDNELWVDLERSRQVEALIDELGGRSRARLVEVFPAPDQAIARGPGGCFASEVVMPFVRAGRPAPRAVVRPSRVTIERRFAPGSSWLYAKLYGGVSTADRVLREAVAPLARAGVADRWFFVRYADPEPHLRVRFRGDAGRLAAELLPALERACAPLLADGTLWRVQLDTYEREVERYGGDLGIEACEEVFWRDAEAALTIVEHLDGDAGGEARWLLALRSADGLLRGLGLDEATRAAVFARGRDALRTEQRAGTPLLKAIGARFRAEEARITAVLAGELDELRPGLDALEARDAALGAVGARLRGLALDGIGWSLVHMSVNRLLHASQRAQELVLYDFLCRHHARRRARAATGAREAAA